MFVISDEQFRRLFHLADDYRAERMLDLGAGDGATGGSTTWDRVPLDFTSLRTLA